MKLTIFDKTGKEAGKIELPIQFSEDYRPDLVFRAAHAIESNNRQRYGVMPTAGTRQSVKLSHRRRDFKTTYGHGISRTPRKVFSRRGKQFNWEGAFAPNTVKGRQAHPPKSDKDWSLKINKKERRKAIRCGLSASIHPEYVSQNGFRLPKNYPFCLDSSFEKISKTKELKDSLLKLDLKTELDRCSEYKIRPGKGKNRGRPYKTKTGPLIVVSVKCDLLNATKNMSGFEVITVDKLNARSLSTGNRAGRLSLYTESAIKKIAENKLFM